MSLFEILAVSPSPLMVQDSRAKKSAIPAVNISIANAAKQAGYLGIADLAFLKLSSAGRSQLKNVIEMGCGLRLGLSQLSEAYLELKSLCSEIRSQETELTIILVPDSLSRNNQIQSPKTKKLLEQIKALSTSGSEILNDKLENKSKPQNKNLKIRLLAEAVSIKEANLLAKLPVDAIIAKGQEAGGIVGETTAFVLMQECLSQLSLPLYVWGGVGLHTAAACYAAGAAGVILDSQLVLAKESKLPLVLKAKLEQFDGTEMQILAIPAAKIAASKVDLKDAKKIEEPKIGLRAYHRLGQPVHADQSNILNDLVGIEEATNLETIYEAIAFYNAESDPTDWILPLGQDVAFAHSLSQKYLSVAGILNGIKAAVDEHINLCRKFKPLALEAPLAKSHGTNYPILQGAMTRVSDKAEFALEVAEAGGLPFLALALMRGKESEVLLSEAQSLLKDKSWGVGILGFVPAELKAEQMAALEKFKPPYVIIAGGRPDQAKHLEDIGIKTYLHVPSPLLLESFIEMGSRRFIFEGKECGGHVGPRSSFVLWETMVEGLLENINAREASLYHIIFAGGIHDAVSAAAVAALSAPLVARGVRVGILMGTAYLFTREAVDSGAIIKKFQDAALKCEQTVLLETGPGHAIRCINSPYKNNFDKKRLNLVESGASREEIREELELMNLGRLRLASKGLIRKDALAELDSGLSSSKDKVIAELKEDSTAQNHSQTKELEQASEQAQWQHGMYMIGQVASLHDKTVSIAELHENVCLGGSQLIDSLPEYLSTDNKKAQPVFKTDHLDQTNDREPIAIIGMSCLLPKAKNVESYWTNILNKVDAIEEVPLYQWDWRNYYDPDPLARDKIYSKWGGFLEDIEFDPTKYGIPPSSLSSIDPMQILLLEVTDAALKDAGYDKKAFPRDRTSVILANAGHGPITALYSLRSMLGWKLSHLDPALKQELEEALPEWTEDSFPGYLGNVTAGRVANRFDLGGVNFSIDAACASSLAALYSGVAELRSKNSDVVFLASADTHNQPGDYLSFSKTHAFSADGHCKTFDASADGIVISEGIAMLVLKRLSDAERDGDRIYAVIKGIGGSSDGRDLSLTAPRPAGQIKALNRAYEDAQVNPNTVTLIEAHGTGTVAGDKAEVEALKQVFELSNAGHQSCAIGSVKTMIGHTKATAGLASLIKVAKALHHKVLPPTIGVKNPNPACHFEEGPFYINSDSRPWILPTGSSSTLNVRRAGVSAFGFGGTNFHVVLEEYSPTFSQSFENQEDPILPAELFVFSGTSINEVCRAITACCEKGKKLMHNEAQEELSLAALAYWQFLKDREHQVQFNKQPSKVGTITRSTKERPAEPGKDSLESKKIYCLAVVASSIADLNEKLNRAKNEIQVENKTQIKDPRGVYFGARDWVNNNKVAFLFPGQGSQYPGMLSQLAIRFAEVRDIFTQANKCLNDKFDKSLSEYIFPSSVFTPEAQALLKEKLTDTRLAQPALGAANIAAFSLLSSFDIQPDMLAGHSYGEYVALCAAGYYDFASLMNISQQRGEILAQSNDEQISSGGMAAVSCSVDQLKKQLPLLPASISIANVNSPGQTVIAGPLSDIEQAISILQSKNLVARIIPVSQAFHTKSMQPAAKKLEAVLDKVSYSDASVDVYSNLQGLKYDRSPAGIASRLGLHTTEPVDFVNQIKTMYADGARVFLEVGPSNVLTNLTQSILEGLESTCIAIDRSGRDGNISLIQALAQLAVSGVRVDFQRLYQFRLDAFKHLLNYEPSTSSKKLIYCVNSATVLPKNKIGEKQPNKLSTSVLSPTSSAARIANTNLELTNQNKGFGNLKIENMPPRSTNLTTPLPNSYNKTSGASVSSAQIDNIMLQFQQSMQQMANSFMETQQRVMLAYLANHQEDEKAGNGFKAAMTLAGEKIDIIKSTDSLSFTASLDATSGNIAAAQSIPVASNINVAAVQSIPVVNNINTAPGLPLVADMSPDLQTDTEYLITTLLEIVADRTGYPVDMIDPSLDLEADLGIDSIKRVEILNKFRRVLPDSKQKELESGIEELAGARTLQGIIDWLRTSNESNSASLENLAQGNGANKEQSPALYVNNQNEFQGNGKHDFSKQIEDPAIERNGDASVIKRGLVVPVSLPVVTSTDLQLMDKLGAIKKKASLVLISTDKHGLAVRLAELLDSRGFVPVLLRQTGEKPKFKTTKSSSLLEREIDLQNFEQVNSCLASLQSEYGSVAMLFHLNSFAEIDAEVNRASALALLFLLKYFNLSAKKIQPDNKTLFIGATSMGGKFGHDLLISNYFAATQAAIAGLIKVAAKELIDHEYKIVDFDLSKIDAKEAIPPSTLETLANQLIEEAVVKDNILEVGYRGAERWGLDVADSSLKVDFSTPPLDKNSVVLITGGARGITAEIAIKLAQSYKPTLILVGRSSLPGVDEDAHYAGIKGIRDLKAKIIESLKNEGKPVNIPEVELRYQSVIKEREIRENMQRLQSNASKVEYHSLDVRDSKFFASLIAGIYKNYGKIDAVIHGAGIIEDALLKDKDKESFERVFDTKVSSALTLIDNLKLDTLQHLFLFSSIVGRTGNAGQADYVAANEVLNKLALAVRDKMPKGRSASIMWGPWKGGMAHPELEELFAEYGWAMIDLQKGSESFIDEMFCSNKKESEVLLVAKAESLAPSKNIGARISTSERVTNSAGDQEYILNLDTQTDVFLLDHAFDGVPVLPMAYALELMCEAAQATYPNLPIRTIEQLDIPAGILFDISKKKISIVVHEEDKTNETASALVSILSGTKRRVNFKARFKLDAKSNTSLPRSAAMKMPLIERTTSHKGSNGHHGTTNGINGHNGSEVHHGKDINLSKYDLGAPVILPPISDIYKQWLFHGKSFHGMKAIFAVGQKGVLGQVTGLDPEKCLHLEKKGNWIIDPVMFDSAMQLGGIWARKCFDITALPTGFQRLAFFSSMAHTSNEPSFVHVIISTESSQNELRCDLAIYNSAGDLLLYVEELSGVGSKSLHRLANQNAATNIEAGVSG